MALRPETEFPGKILAGNANYPQGEARNITLANDGTGTPWLARPVNDLWGFLQRLLLDAAITPSGSPDTVLASDYKDALDLIFSRMSSANIFTQNQTIQGLFPQMLIEQTGQSAKARVIQYDSRGFLAWNAYRDAAGWQRDDTAFSSWLFGMGAGNGDIISAFHSPAGTGIVSFANVFSFDNTGKMTIGKIALSLRQEHQYSTGVSSASIVFPSVVSGDLIHLECFGEVNVTAAGAFHQLLCGVTAGFGVFEPRIDLSNTVSPASITRSNIGGWLRVTGTGSITIQATNTATAGNSIAVQLRGVRHIG